MSTFTIATDPTTGHDGRPSHWHGLSFDGPKITGAARVTSYIDKGQHVVLIDLSPTLDDGNGSTVYRTADPDADEIQTGMAVIRNPVRVNGIAYSGTIYVEHAEHAGRWRPDTSYLSRIGGPFYTGVTDAARRALRTAAVDIAAQFATTEREAADRESAARSVVDRARKALDEAQAAYEAATEALVEIQTQRVSASR
jgi:hypothetical protein